MEEKELTDRQQQAAAAGFRIVEHAHRNNIPLDMGTLIDGMCFAGQMLGIETPDILDALVGLVHSDGIRVTRDGVRLDAMTLFSKPPVDSDVITAGQLLLDYIAERDAKAAEKAS